MSKLRLSLIVSVIVLIICVLGYQQTALAEQPGTSSDDMVALGRAIFFDSNLSTPRGQSCATCHDPEAGFADPNHLAVSQGVLPNRVGNRNAQSVAYAAL